jgi:molybdopterin molybdotransferase
MLTLEVALQLVLEQTSPLTAQSLPLVEALGLVLAEDIVSDVDSPPHDKSIVDGYAIRSEDLSQQSRFEVLEEVTAGQVPTKSVARGQATRIMTGAPIPDGADTVVMIERTRLEDSQSGAQLVRIDSAACRPGQNIIRQGVSMRRGEVVLSTGSVLRPIELGLLAEVGRATVQVYPRPRVAVLATGDELVPVHSIPAPGQIRNSNGPMLVGCVAQAGGEVMDLGCCRDDQAALASKVDQGLGADILLLSGGVSAGVLDLVPAVLEQAGVNKVFHKVSLKPGKPLWFGVCTRDRRRTLVFGLPGNPVSSLVCFELFVRPAIRALGGHSELSLQPAKARLAEDFQHRGDRPTYFPAKLDTSTDSPNVSPLAWQGSGDLRTLAAANGLAYFPAGDQLYAAGSLVTVYRLPE